MLGEKRALFIISKRTPGYIVDELYILSRIAGYKKVDNVTIRPKGSKFRISDEKLSEIGMKVEKNNIETIIVEPHLPPSEILSISRATKREVIDRTLLLLEVFERNAGSQEAKLQIQMARMKHELPILRETVNRAKKGELPGFLAGGAYAIDKYYRHLRKKASEYAEKLERIRKQREFLRRKRLGNGFVSVAIVGYANAGKTTLFNTLTNSKKEVGSDPFTTISPKVSRSSSGLPLFYIDTVGFVMNVPPEIVDAFHATLEEITFSDIVLFVVDFTEKIDLVLRRLHDASYILRRIDAYHKPLVLLLNKIDKLSDTTNALEKILSLRKLVESEYPGLASIILGSASSRVTRDLVEEVLWSLSGQKRSLSGLATGLKEIRELRAM